MQNLFLKLVPVKSSDQPLKSWICFLFLALACLTPVLIPGCKGAPKQVPKKDATNEVSSRVQDSHDPLFFKTDTSQNITNHDLRQNLDQLDRDLEIASDRDITEDSADQDVPAQQNTCESLPDGLRCLDGAMTFCHQGALLTKAQCTIPCTTQDRCPWPAEGFCVPTPPVQSPAPPDELCNNMDWLMSPDGYYLISQFGTTWDPTTADNNTSCGWLQGHYDYYKCIHDTVTDTCLGDDYIIPWIHGWVNYDYDQVLETVAANMNGDVPIPEYFYVADSQRFGCGALLRVTRVATGKCVVVYTEDGGPNAFYETEDKGGRRIFDSSPAVIEYLEIQQHGWGNSELVYVEWAKEGDIPGQACAPCASIPAKQGTEALMTPHRVVHMMSYLCP
jgi:hypothetical protein